MRHSMLILAVVLMAAVAVNRPASAEAQAAPTVVRVVVPDGDNLQFLSFWVALGARLFEAEGLAVEVVVPPAPPLAGEWLLEGRAEVAVLPPPMYVSLIARQAPILVFANLLQNDPINLVVRPEVAAARGLSPGAPLAERLRGLQGLRIGVAPGPPTRLRMLFAAAGMDADRDVEVVLVPGAEQNRAFGEGQVDALYAHTPYLERALVDQGAVLLVDQSGGEVPALAARQIHALVTTRQYAQGHPAALAALARAISGAQQLVHADLAAAADALLRSGVPGLERRHVEALLQLYRPAVPRTPVVSAEGVRQANEYFPASGTPPDLSRVDVAAYVAPRVVGEALGARVPAAVRLPRTGGGPVPAGAAAALGAGAVALALGLIWGRRDAGGGLRHLRRPPRRQALPGAEGTGGDARAGAQALGHSGREATRSARSVVAGSLPPDVGMAWIMGPRSAAPSR